MKAYIETYGCRMNIYDSEILMSILSSVGYMPCFDIEDTDIIILNCCSVREVGHEKIISRLENIAQKRLQHKTIVICGCFATQTDSSLFDKYPFVDIIIGPDSYRELPELLQKGESHVIRNKQNNDELYSDIIPLRIIEDKTTAAITVMKGCNQRCTYCIEPITRGNEHSRDEASVLRECQLIASQGYRELTLVGHIIDRYRYGFAQLLDKAASLCPDLRIKFLSSHPVTFTDEIIDVIKRHDNIMRVVHLPVQSGSDAVLKRMNRGYTITQFKDRYRKIKSEIPDMSIVTDIMVGFPGETETEFMETYSLVSELVFDDINVFEFSMRKGTVASLRYKDDIPEDIKRQRFSLITGKRDEIRLSLHTKEIGSTVNVISEGTWHKDEKYSFGRDNRLRTVIFKNTPDVLINDSVSVLITGATHETLIGVVK